MLLLALVLSVASCGPAKEVRRVSLRMTGSPSQASVTIDDIFVGRLETVAARGVALPLGPHHVTVEAAGFFPNDQVIEATEAASPIRLDVHLIPIPD
ncbi:MAG: hypothetical protein KIT84_24190 [Labilithrix sp.]|nr:hypothetical protein [Labilithrix sp.]MCW5814150.1 hypothetical protein [Labilithrix sp.]